MFHWEMVIVARLNKVDPDKIIKGVHRDLVEGARKYMQNGSGHVKVKRMMSETIDEKVYNKYTPKEYKRREKKGRGLNDTRNMAHKVTIDKDRDKDVTTGHLCVTNKTRRSVLPGSKKKYEYVNNFEDFLYMIKDEGQVYDITKGASPSYEEWGNGGRPLNLNKALDKKVQNSDELKNKFREQTLAYAQRRQKSKRGD